MWMSLFFITLILSVFVTCLVQVQTRKIDELETKNWELRQGLEQYQMYFERRRMDDLGDKVDGWLEHLDAPGDWYDEAWEDINRSLGNDFDNS